MFKRFIDFSVFEGSQEEVECWINQFNLLRDTIKIDRWSYGTHVEFNLEMFSGSRFFEKGMFDIRLHQKPENKFLYLPAKSGYEPHTISNYVSGELKKYARSNANKINFLAVKIKFFRRLLDSCFRKKKLKRVFNKIKYSNRKLLLLPKISCSVDQQRIPEYLMDSILEANLENIFQKNMKTEVPVTTLPQTESLFQIRALNKPEVANGTTSPALASSNLIHSTEFLSLRSEFYKYANDSDTTCIPCD